MKNFKILSVCLLIMAVFSSCFFFEEPRDVSSSDPGMSSDTETGSNSGESSVPEPEPETVITEVELSLYNSEGEKIEFSDTEGDYQILSLAENKRAETFNGVRLGDSGGDAVMAFEELISKVEAFSKHSYYSEAYKQEEEKLKAFNAEVNRKFYSEYYNPYAEIMKAENAGFILKFEVIVLEDEAVLKALRKTDTQKLYNQSGELSAESIELLQNINEKTRYIITLEVTDSELTDLIVLYKKK